MNPEQQLPPAPTQQSDPYAFIMNGGEAPKPGLFSGGGSSKKRLLFLGGAGLIFLLIIFMFISLVFSGGQGQTDKLLSLAQQQNELIRVSDLAKKDTAAQSATTQILASNTSLSLQTAQQQILELMSKADRSKSQKQLGATQSAKTDQTLKSAALNNRYDETYKELMNKELTTYQAKLKSTFDSSSNTKEKQVLDNAYKGATLLLSQTK